MIFLEIIGAILLLLLLILFSPITVFLKFDGEFYAKIFLYGLKVFSYNPNKPTKPKKDKKKSKSETERSKKESHKKKKKKDSLFTFLKKKHGFLESVKLLLELAKNCLVHIKSLLRHIKLKKITLDLTVACGDAAETAIQFGRISAALYPVLSFLDSFKNIGFKQINVKSDFSGEKSIFKFSVAVKLQIFYFLVVAFKIYSEYKKFISKEKYNERE